VCNVDTDIMCIIEAGKKNREGHKQTHTHTHTEREREFKCAYADVEK
jgi:hypothetical protein